MHFDAEFRVGTGHCDPHSRPWAGLPVHVDCVGLHTEVVGAAAGGVVTKVTDVLPSHWARIVVGKHGQLMHQDLHSLEAWRRSVLQAFAATGTHTSRRCRPLDLSLTIQAGARCADMVDPAASAFIVNDLLLLQEGVHGVLGVFPRYFPNARISIRSHFQFVVVSSRLQAVVCASKSDPRGELVGHWRSRNRIVCSKAAKGRGTKECFVPPL